MAGRAPPGLGSLSAEELADLRAAIDDARHRQAAALQKAGDAAFRQIPWLLRGPIRKIMGA